MRTTLAARMMSVTTSISEAQLALAMIDVANDLHDDLAIEAGRDMETISDTDIIAAMRQPVSMASAFADLCERLGVVPPAAVLRALDTE